MTPQHSPSTKKRRLAHINREIEAQAGNSDGKVLLMVEWLKSTDGQRVLEKYNEMYKEADIAPLEVQFYFKIYNFSLIFAILLTIFFIFYVGG